MGEFRELLYRTSEDEETADEGTGKRQESSSPLRIRLGMFYRPSAVVAALGRDILRRAGARGGSAVRLSLSLRFSSACHIVLDGLHLVHAVWMDRDEEGGPRLAEAEDAERIVSKCPVVYGTFMPLDEGDDEGQQSREGKYLCPVIAGGFTARVSVGSVVGHVAMGVGLAPAGASHWAKRGVYISAN